MKKILTFFTLFLALITLSLMSTARAEEFKVVVDASNVDKYFNFSGTAGYTKSTNKMNLLNNQKQSVGLAYFNERLSVKRNFKVSLNVRLAGVSTPADGLAIGFSESPIGTTGDKAQGFGVAGLRNGTFFVIDTFRNDNERTVPNVSVRHTKEGQKTFFNASGNNIGYTTTSTYADLISKTELSRNTASTKGTLLEIDYNATNREISYKILGKTYTGKISANSTSLAFLISTGSGGSTDIVDVYLHRLEAFLVTEAPTSITITMNNQGESYTFSPKKPGTNARYQQGTKIFVGDHPTPYIIGSNGSVVVPAADMIRYDSTETIYIQEPNKDVSEGIKGTNVPGRQTVTPVVTRTVGLGQPMVVNLKKPDGTLYPQNSIVTIEGFSNAFYTNSQGNISIPYDTLPEFDEESTVIIKQANKESSESVILKVHGRKTISPETVEIIQDHEGNLTITPKKLNGDLYDGTAKVQIDNNKIYNINANGTFTIPAAELSINGKLSSIKVQDINKEYSAELNLEIPGRHDAKKEYIDSLDIEERKYQDMIDELSELGNINEFKNELEVSLANYKKLVNDTTSAQEAAAIVETAKTEFKAIYDRAKLQEAKEKEIKKIEEKSQSLKAMVDSLDSLTAEEKTAQKAQILQTKNQVTGNVEEASTIEDVIGKSSQGIKKLEDVFLRATQLNARNELDKYLVTTTAYIRQLPAVEPERQQEFIDELTRIVNNTKGEIGLADDQLTVINLTKKARDDMFGVTLVASKENAKTYLESLLGATPSNKLKEILQTYKGIIDNQNNYAEVEAQMYRGITAINLELKKAEQKNALTDYETTLIDKIDNLKNLLADDKNEFKRLLGLEKETEFEKIDDKSTVSEVLLQFENSKLELDKIIINARKADAKKELENKKTSIESMIDNIAGLSQVEKQNFKQQLIDARTSIEALIDVKSNDDSIRQEKENGITIYEDILLSAQKAGRKNELDSKLNTAKEAIESLPNLTSDKKEAYKGLLDQIANTAKNEMDSAHNNISLDEIYNKAISDLNKQVALATNENQTNIEGLKTGYQTDLEERANSINSLIERLSHLDSEEKNYFKDRVTGILNTSKTAMEELEEAAIITDLYDQAILDMQAELTSSVILNEKNEALFFITQKRDNVLEILGTIELDPKQLEVIKEELDKILNNGKTTLNEQTGLIQIRSTKQSILTEMDKIYPKAYRASRVEQVMKKHKEVSTTIATFTELEDEKKMEFKDRADAYIQNLENKIGEGTLENAYAEAQDIIQKLNELLVEAQMNHEEYIETKKQNFTDLFKDKVDAATKEINSYEFLTPRQKVEIINEYLEKIRSETITRIENANIVEDAEENYNEGSRLVDELLLTVKKENAYGQIEKNVLELLDGGTITEEIAKVALEVYKDISEATTYEEIDKLTKESINTLRDLILVEVNLVKNEVREKLIEYAGTPLSPELEEKIDKAVEKVSPQNYNDPIAIEVIIENGKKMIDEYYQLLINNEKNNVKEILKEYAGENNAELVSEIIQEFIDKINKENFQNETEKNNIISDAKVEIEKLINQNLEEKQQQLEEELKKHGTPLDDVILEIIKKEKDKITKDTHNDKTYVDNLIQEGKDAIDAYKLEQAKAKAKDKLDEYMKNGNSSNELAEKIKDGKEIIEQAHTIDEIDRIVNEIILQLLEQSMVDYRLREFENIYITYANSGRYDEEGKLELKRIYESTKKDIKDNQLGLSDAVERFNKAENDFKKVKLYQLFNQDFRLYDKNIKYLSGQNNIYLAVSNSNGLDHGTQLHVKKEKINSDDHGRLKDVFKNATRTLSPGTNTNQIGLLDDVLNQSILRRIEIKILDHQGSVINDFEGEYLVSFLLPDEVRGSTKFTVAHVKDDGTVEVFEVNRVDDWLIFTTTHFSEFYLLGTITTSNNVVSVHLTWIIIAILIIIVLEIIAIVLKKKNNRLRHNN